MRTLKRFLILLLIEYLLTIAFNYIIQWDGVFKNFEWGLLLLPIFFFIPSLFVAAIVGVVTGKDKIFDKVLLSWHVLGIICFSFIIGIGLFDNIFNNNRNNNQEFYHTDQILNRDKYNSDYFVDLALDDIKNKFKSSNDYTIVSTERHSKDTVLSGRKKRAFFIKTVYYTGEKIEPDNLYFAYYMVTDDSQVHCITNDRIKYGSEGYYYLQEQRKSMDSTRDIIAKIRDYDSTHNDTEEANAMKDALNQFNVKK